MFTKIFKFTPELVVTECKKIRRFIQRLNIEIQESLAAAQITTFMDVLDKARKVENAKLQSKIFHARKRGNPSNVPRPSERSTQPLKMGKEDGGVRMSEKSRGVPTRGAPPKENQNGRDQPKENSQAGQAVTPRVTCGYCGKSNHTEAECWRK